MADSCGTCRFCVVTSNTNHYCHRYAPRPETREGFQLARWPMVIETNWCGEHVPAVPAVMLDRLAAELERWCMDQRLPFISADELVSYGVITDGQREWLVDFLERWQEYED